MRYLYSSILRGARDIFSRRLYVALTLVVPVFCTVFFLSLMHSGLPTRIPVAVVDLDDSTLSRRMTMNLNASQTVSVDYRVDSYSEAMAMIREGEIYGFFLIPEHFQKDAIAGRGPAVALYTNMAYFVPGTLSYKGFVQTAVSVSGGLVTTRLVSMGVSEATAGDLLIPVALQEHPIGNPWLNYSIYLSQSFIPGIIALLVLLMTSFSICQEVKRGTSVEWLRTGGGSMLTALLGKLLPQTILFTCMGVLLQVAMMGYLHFPMHCSYWHMFWAMLLMVVGQQSLAVFMCECVPNLRLSVAACSLLGILSFSFTGFSYPVANMYGSIAAFSYIVPLRYYFLIYIDQALNGIPLYYSRFYYLALLAFPVLALPMLGRLRRFCLNPVYLP